MSELVDRLHSLTKAYPEDVFTPLTPEEIEQHSNIVTRASASMGRHFAGILTDAADRIAALDAANGRLQAALRRCCVNGHLPWCDINTVELVTLPQARYCTCNVAALLPKEGT